MRVLRLAASILLLALTLGTPAASAASAASAPTAAERGDLLLQLRAFLVSLWSAEGCEIDPWGHCTAGPKATAPRVLTAKEGCEIDPLGRCGAGPKATAPSVLTAKEGCRLDPLGSCITSH